MDVCFSSTTDGRIDALLGTGWELFDEALADAVAPRPARDGSGLSTWSIDVVERRARDAAARHSEGTLEDVQCELALGNHMWLRFHDGDVIAERQWEEGNDTESMPLDEFFALLALWRDRVLSVGGHSTAPPSAHERVWAVGSTSLPDARPRSLD